MDNLKKNNFRSIFFRRRVLFVVVVSIVLIAMVILAFLYSNPSEEVLPDEVGENTPYELIPTRNRKEITYNNYKVTLPASWEVMLTADGLRSTGVTCSNKEECTIFMVSNGNADYFISIPGNIKHLSFDTPVNFVEKVFNFGNVRFTESVLNRAEGGMSSSPNEIEELFEPIIGEVSGCLERVICFNSGGLNINPEINKTQLENFYKFVESLTIQD